MAKADVKITNGDLEAWVTARSAKAFERHGWTIADDGSSGSEAPEAPEAEEKPKPVKKTTTRKAAD